MMLEIKCFKNQIWHFSWNTESIRKTRLSSNLLQELPFQEFYYNDATFWLRSFHKIPGVYRTKPVCFDTSIKELAQQTPCQYFQPHLEAFLSGTGTQRRATHLGPLFIHTSAFPISLVLQAWSPLLERLYPRGQYLATCKTYLTLKPPHWLHTLFSHTQLYTTSHT